MTEDTAEGVFENKQQEEHKRLYEMAKKVMYASIGAAVLAQEEAEAFINKLIERGEIAKKDGGTLIDDLKEKRQKRVKAAEEHIEKRVEKVMARVGVPNKTDIEILSEKIAELTKKVEELKAAQEGD